MLTIHTGQYTVTFLCPPSPRRFSSRTSTLCPTPSVSVTLDPSSAAARPPPPPPPPPPAPSLYPAGNAWGKLTSLLFRFYYCRLHNGATYYVLTSKAHSTSKAHFDIKATTTRSVRNACPSRRKVQVITNKKQRISWRIKSFDLVREHVSFFLVFRIPQPKALSSVHVPQLRSIRTLEVSSHFKQPRLR